MKEKTETIEQGVATEQISEATGSFVQVEVSMSPKTYDDVAKPKKLAKTRAKNHVEETNDAITLGFGDEALAEEQDDLVTEEKRFRVWVSF
jgi:hypothetical protein